MEKPGDDGQSHRVPVRFRISQRLPRPPRHPADRKQAAGRLRLCARSSGGIFKATNNQSPATAFAHIPAKLAYDRLEIDRFCARHGIADYRMNPHFPVNTLTLMRGAIAAQHLGLFAPYVEAVFCAMWRDGLKMDDPEVFAPRSMRPAFRPEKSRPEARPPRSRAASSPIPTARSRAVPLAHRPFC
jgi:hypothetical protein